MHDHWSLTDKRNFSDLSDASLYKKNLPTLVENKDLSQTEHSDFAMNSSSEENASMRVETANNLNEENVNQSRRPSLLNYMEVKSVKIYCGRPLYITHIN